MIAMASLVAARNQNQKMFSRKSSFLRCLETFNRKYILLWRQAWKKNDVF